MRAAILATIFLSMLAALPASAQDTADLQQFRPSAHGGELFTVESAAATPSLDLRASVFFNYAYRPLQLVRRTGNRAGALVDHRLDAHVLGSIALFDRLSIGLSIPAALFQGGSLDAVATGGAATRLASLAFGDLRLDAKAFLRPRRFFMDIAVLLALTVPTGNERAFTGDKSINFSSELDLSRRFGPVTIAGNMGYTWRPRARILNLIVDQEFYYRAGIAFEIGRLVEKLPLTLVAEIFGRTSAVKPFKIENQNPMEWLVGIRATFFGRMMLSLGGGRGILPGYGAPSARAFLGLGFIIVKPKKAPVVDAYGEAPASQPVPPPAPKDTDGDGFTDDVDYCDSDAEDKDSYQDEDGCPDPDNDSDKVLDGVDACPNHPEDLDQFEDENGCAEPDNDGDGILDGADECPNLAEVVNNVKDFDGCPDKGKTLVEVTSSGINILDKVYFAVASDRILPRSKNLLRQIATVLKNHGEIKKLRVEGHTDDAGNDATNLKLSQRRADSVMKALVKDGVDPARLEAVGYGETKPVTSNKTKRGKEQNRRVAFTIVEQPIVEQPSVDQPASQP